MCLCIWNNWLTKKHCRRRGQYTQCVSLTKVVGIYSLKKPPRSSNQFSDFTGKAKRGPEVAEWPAWVREHTNWYDDFYTHTVAFTSVLYSKLKTMQIFTCYFIGRNGKCPSFKMSKRFYFLPADKSIKLYHYLAGLLLSQVSPKEAGTGGDIYVWQEREQRHSTHTRIGVPCDAKMFPTGSEGFTSS